MTTVLIADDHPVFRHGLAQLLEESGEFRVVAECANAAAALRGIADHHPDIAVLDIAMPGQSGLDVVRIANEQDREVEFVMLTMYQDEVYFNRAMDLGVKGYLLKETAMNDLLAALRAVADGRFYVSPLVSHYLVKKNEQLRKTYSNQPGLKDLTATERTVLKLIAENKTSREIGAILNISYRTVQTHRTNICTKLDLKGYNTLLNFALRHKESF